jgi:uncharacterized OB-fold protein
MSEPKRPLPRHDEPDTREFWAATKDKEFRYQQCDDCEKIVFYPRRHCTGCTSGNLSWKTSKGKGKVYTFSVVRQSYHPFFRNLVPYAVAWVDLDEGPRLATNIIGVEDPSTDVKIGQEVTLEWEEYEELSIPLFRPV